MATFPPDQFDEVPADLKRVGAHRTPAKRGRGWIAFAWAALATGLLVIAGLYGMSRLNPDISFELPSFGGGEEPAPGPSPSRSTVAPITDPSQVPEGLAVSISVFNGTAAEGLQNTAGDAIQDAGWPNPTRANASSREVATTVVYYSSAEYEGVARGIAQLLGFQSVQLTDIYKGAPITVVLGDDYATIAGSTEG